MLRNRYRRDTAIVPFRIRNNYRRLSTRFDYALSRPQVPSNDDDETMLHEDFDNDDDEMMLHENSDNDDEMMLQPLEQKSNDDDVDMTSALSENEEGYDDAALSESEEYHGDQLSSGSDDDYYYEERGYDYVTSSESEGENDANTLPEVVDAALDENKLPRFGGDFAPYFQDFTTAALFCWIHKHNISTNAYEDLVDIITKPEFNKNHIIKNIRRFRTWRQHLPLLPISAKSIPISSKNTPSTSKDSKMSYQLSIGDIIWYVLNNPSLFNNMYFGPGINSETKSEYWHGTLWAESPLFGEEQLTISGVIYKSGDFIYYHDNEQQKLGRLRAILKNDHDNQYQLRIQKVLNYDDLPKIFKKTSRQNRSFAGEVWLQDEPFYMITAFQIIAKATVVIKFQHQNISEGILQITEIIYKHNAHWRIRDASLSYQHPSDYITIRPPPFHMPVYKLFIDLYYDDFGTYRNVYHSLGGVYIQFGNMPIHLRKLIKNHFVLGFVPFGGNFNEFILPFIHEMEKLEQGTIMKVRGQDAWVIAGLGVVTADLPQGNDLAGVKRQNATKGCRTCTVSRELYTNVNQDVPATSRYHHIVNMQLEEILQETVISKKEQLSKKYGLKLQPSILDKLKRERHLQTPQDIYHATAGKIGRLLNLTCDLFSKEGENDFIKTWKSFEKPKKWSRIPNPISHRDSFMMSDYLRLAMIMPFLLNNFLKTSSLKPNELKVIQQRINASRSNLVKNIIISCWVHVAKTMKIVFESKFNTYNELQQCLEEEMTILPKVFPEFINLPNLHINVHLLMHAKTYGTLINTQVGIKEMIHRIFKAMVLRTNHKNIELDLLKRYTTLFAIRHLADGGIDQRLSQSCYGFTNMSSNFGNLLTNWYIIDDKMSNEQQLDENTNVTSPVPFIRNITLKKEISKQDRDNIIRNLVNFNSELYLSFKDIGFKSALIYTQMNWYELAAYTIEEIEGVFSKIHLHIGDFIIIQEENYNECYAIIKGIFKYKGNNDKFYPFIVIDWFEDINKIHNVLKCPLYRIQATQDIRWRRIYPISIIDQIQKIHFIYDSMNDLWIKNNYYFTAI